jgi:hypothetical protein
MVHVVIVIIAFTLCGGIGVGATRHGRNGAATTAASVAGRSGPWLSIWITELVELLLLGRSEVLILMMGVLLQGDVGAFIHFDLRRDFSSTVGPVVSATSAARSAAALIASTASVD